MKAVGYQQSLPSADPLSLQDIELPQPQAQAHDLLVRVCAIAVNPIDTKVRMRAQPAAGEWKVLGWDACGIVESVGSSVSLFKPGERVWYAGALSRAGSNSELQLVDEKLVGRAPQSLNDAQAAALPLTSVTAWEMLFDRLGIVPNQKHDHTILIYGAAGGVGSIMVQLARYSGLNVIATASRPETAQWVLDLGAHAVINHHLPLVDELKRIGAAAPHYVVSLTRSEEHFAQIAMAIAPQGKFGLIDDPVAGSIDVGLLKSKSVSLHWESMFTRSSFKTEDMIAQHRLLNEVSTLVDAGALRSTLGDHFGAINAAHLRKAHARLESGTAKGKIVLEGF